MWSLKKSSVEEGYWEVHDGSSVVEELFLSFKLRGVPRFFSSFEEIKGWLEREEKRLGRQLAYAALGRRSLSSLALKEKLKQKGISEPKIKEVLAELEKLGYIADDEYYERAIEQLLQKGFGPYKIAEKLSLNFDEVARRISLEREKEALLRFKGKFSQLKRRGFRFETLDLLRN